MPWIYAQDFYTISVVFALAVMIGLVLWVRHLNRVITKLESENARLTKAHVCFPPRWGAHPRDPLADDKLGGNWLCPCGTGYVIDSYVYDKRLGKYRFDWITTEEFVTGVRPASDRQQRPDTTYRPTLPGSDPRGSL